MAKLKTRNVFIDAEAFRAGSFNYDSTTFRMLASLAAADEVRIFVTDITLREVQALIRKEIGEAVRAQQSFEQKAYIIRNCKSRLVRRRLDALNAYKVEEELLRQLARFLKKTKTIVLPTDSVKIADVFDRYFASTPPFGPDRKKSEFPDAFAAAAVRDWCIKKNEEIYVVSGDGDMQAVCGDGLLHSLAKLSEFLDAVASHNESLVAFVKEEIPKLGEQIIKEVKAQFTDRGFILDDQDGEVEDVRVLEVVLGEMDVIQAGETEATLETEAEVTFEAELSYGDEGTSSYDSEDKTVFYHDYVQETVQRTEHISVEINAFYEARDPDSFEINDVSIDRNTLLVSSSRDEGWPWK